MLPHCVRLIFSLVQLKESSEGQKLILNKVAEYVGFDAVKNYTRWYDVSQKDFLAVRVRIDFFQFILYVN